MKLLNKLSYQKKEPWRDATIFIIVCEGSETEKKYFDFFHLLTERIKVYPVPSTDGMTAPKYLFNNAENAYAKYSSDGGKVELWFVIDVDRWVKQIHELHNECSTKPDWNIAISNPCFEVWLNAHFEPQILPLVKTDQCSAWKSHVHTTYGGFNPNTHQTYLPKAIAYCEQNYQAKGYMPETGSTQVYILGQKIYDLTLDVFDGYAKPI